MARRKPARRQTPYFRTPLKVGERVLLRDGRLGTVVSGETYHPIDCISAIVKIRIDKAADTDSVYAINGRHWMPDFIAKNPGSDFMMDTDVVANRNVTAKRAISGLKPQRKMPLVKGDRVQTKDGRLGTITEVGDDEVEDMRIATVEFEDGTTHSLWASNGYGHRDKEPRHGYDVIFNRHVEGQATVRKRTRVTVESTMADIKKFAEAKLIRANRETLEDLIIQLVDLLGKTNDIAAAKKSILDDANASAEAIIAKAKGQAEQLVETGNRNCKAIADMAREEYDRVLRDAASEVAIMRQGIDREIEAAVESRIAEMYGRTGTIKRPRVRHLKMEKLIDKV